MKTITINVYTFDELIDKAKDKAREWCRDGMEYFWADDNRKSLEVFAGLFPLKLTDWSYGGRGEGVSFRFNDDMDPEKLTGPRLFKWLVNRGIPEQIGKDGDCKLTGYCIDEDLLDPLRVFLKKPAKDTSFKELLEDCFRSWVKACNADYEYQYSDECVDEHIEANGYTFTETGKREG